MNILDPKKIMKSMKEHWKGLTLFVDNPEIPMDNNLAERILRLLVVGRKNYWGNPPPNGGLISPVLCILLSKLVFFITYHQENFLPIILMNV